MPFAGKRCVFARQKVMGAMPFRIIFVKEEAAARGLGGGNLNFHFQVTWINFKVSWLL